MIDEQKARLLIADGLAAVCAWCEHLWQARELAPTAECQHPECGGPALGRCFPSYKGPLAGNVGAICFVCGQPAQAAIQLGTAGFLGVCEAHLPVFRRLLTQRGGPPPVIRERATFATKAAAVG